MITEIIAKAIEAYIGVLEVLALVKLVDKLTCSSISFWYNSKHLLVKGNTSAMYSSKASLILLALTKGTTFSL